MPTSDEMIKHGVNNDLTESGIVTVPPKLIRMCIGRMKFDKDDG